MDGYFKSVRKPTAPYPPRTLTRPDKERQNRSSSPSSRRTHHTCHRLAAPLSVGGKKSSSAAITKHLLNTLSDSSNPITHSNIYERSDTVVSATTGHQRGEGRTPHGISAKVYFQDRSRKVSLQQRGEFREDVLNNVRVYIDGYLSVTTDVEMKRIIAQAGGTTLLAPSGATHIVTSRQLSGSKTHGILTTKPRNPVHVVQPEWVTDSIMAGRRLPESHYAVIRSSSTRSLVDMFKSGGSS